MSKSRLLFFWRILFIITVIGLYLVNWISFTILFTIFSGIIIFNGIPWLYTIIRQRFNKSPDSPS